MKSSRDFQPLMAMLLCLAFAGVALAGTEAGGDGALPPGIHTGAATCASTVCHGSAAERAGEGILFNEYVVWSQSDPHARTFRTLQSADSRRIAERLGLPAADTAPVCLACHSDYVAADKRGAKHQFSDGVACEACHGAASGWLQSHTRAGATHKENLARGLYPLENPQARAEQCIACHVGNESRFAGHDIMGAGHPRLQFEFVNWQRMQSPHFRVDADYTARKPQPDEATQWAIGQLTTAETLLRTIDSPRLDADGVWMELALFDCHACHAPMNAGKSQPRAMSSRLKPGAVRVNDSALLMAGWLAQARDAGNGQQMWRAIDELHVASRTSREALRGNARALAAGMAAQRAQLGTAPLGDAQVRHVVARVLDAAANGDFNDYMTAEQSAMAVDILLRSRFPAEHQRLAVPVDALFATLRDQHQFRAPAFAVAAQKLRDAWQRKGKVAP
jgi:hypothetical protein